MKPFKDTSSRKGDWIAAAAVAAVAAATFLPGLAGYAFPGESARLAAVWLGLDVSSQNLYPVMAMFAGLFGAGNLLAAVCGIVASVALFHLVSFFLRERVGGEYSASDAVAIGRIGGVGAALAFIFAPAVIESATHLDPRLFDAAWALLALSLTILHARLPGKIAWLCPVASGAMLAMGVADTSALLLLSPIFVGAAWAVSLKRGGKGYGAAALFVLSFAAVLLFWTKGAVGDFDEYVKAQRIMFATYRATELWIVVPLFATAPFAVSLFSSGRAFGASRGWMEWMFHAVLTLVTILAVATDLSPSAVMSVTRVPPVIATAFAAFNAGYVLAYWWSQTRRAESLNESVDERVSPKTARAIGWSVGGVFAFVLAISFLVNRLIAFDASAGAFADGVASRIVDDLGGRTWLVTDGSIDGNLLLAAHRAGKELHLVCLDRERDKTYIESLAAAVKATSLGGDACEGLVDVLSKYPELDLKRIVPFIQKWFASDPDVASKAAVFGAPDFWLYANVEPVAETFFFGGDVERAGKWDAWPEIDAILHAPKGWGSYGLYKSGSYVKDDHLDFQRLNLRRHVGLVATDCGYSFHERARKLQESGDAAGASELYEKAFAMYELVLNEIDSDNVCALFNEFELTRAGFAKALAKQKQILARMNRIKDDETRRYSLGELGLFYGYICNPEIILRYGMAMLRSGRPGDALNQIRRAIEFVPSENRAMAELNFLAAAYASGGNREKARAIYDNALLRDSDNREAWTGLARLAMLDGDTAKAVEYLEKATGGREDDPAVFSQMAMLLLIQDKLDEAKDLLRRTTDRDRSNMEAWSLLAMTVMRQIDALGDVSKNPVAAEKKDALEKELSETIIPAMEAQSRAANDYHLQTVKAFLLMRKGDRDADRQARDIFLAVAKDRPIAANTSDMILNLDMKLDDKADAERQAAETIAVDAGDPMANYVLGSIALGKGDIEEAEKRLRVSAGAKRPVPLAFNDLAEVFRRKKDYENAEKFARLATEAAPGLYVVWETLGSVLMDAGKSFDEAEQCILKACELSKDANGRPADVRMLVSLARVQIRRGEKARAKATLRAVLSRIDELSEFERREFEELRKSAR